MAPRSTRRFGGIDRAVPAYVQIAREIIAAIQDGRFGVGSRLPAEAELGRVFEVSRPSVREALSALQFAGFLESRKGSGTMVVASVPSLPHDPANGDAKSTDVAFLEARIVLEPEAAWLAAVEPDPAGLRAARAILAGMELAIGASTDLGLQSDLNFHAAIARMCPNLPLGGFVVSLLARATAPSWQTLRSRAWTDDGLLSLWLGHHTELVEAFAGRDPDRARDVLRGHLLSVADHALTLTGLSTANRRQLEAVLDRHPPVARRAAGKRPGVRAARPGSRARSHGPKR